MKREEWLEFARQLDWTPSYVADELLFPAEQCGAPSLSFDQWKSWEEPFRTSFPEYVSTQAEKETAVAAIHAALGKPKDVRRQDPGWQSVVKLHAATLCLAEFAAVIGNLRAARFGRVAPWRTMALFGALDELRHTQIPLRLMHSMVPYDAQYDWTHRLYHSQNWVSIAARHAFDELLLTAPAIEFAVGTHFVFETGFTNLQFVALSAVADQVDDKLFESLLLSIQTDEARHAQIGASVLEIVAKEDTKYAQYLVDKWFWRSWLLFSVVTGIAMDYLTPVSKRTQSFKEFVQEWVVDHFLASLERFGLKRPWYWSIFEQSVENYHHMIYASAYSYRASVWFDMVLPGPDERAWLRRKYPDSWAPYEPVWDQVTAAWKKADPGVDFAVHATAIPTFCNLCQLVLSHGTPARNDAVSCEIAGRKRIFCSEPCRWIFEQERERYQGHNDIVQRVLMGEAPGNLVAFLTEYCGLTYGDWGKDVHGGAYPWMARGEE